MMKVLMLPFFVLNVFLVRNSGTASIGIPMNGSYILESNGTLSLINMTEEEYFKGIMIFESNRTTGNNYGNVGVIVTEITDHDPNLNISDFITQELNVTNIIGPSEPLNITCTRRDYNGDVAAVFREQAGPISSAFIVFNTTYDSPDSGRIFNTTELIDLKMFNETIVNCSEYSVISVRRLNIWAQHSLVG